MEFGKDFVLQINKEEIEDNINAAYVLERMNNKTVHVQNFYQRGATTIYFKEIPSNWMRFLEEETRPRHQVSMDDINSASEEVVQHLLETLKMKGSGIFVSSHEILGVLTEEMMEFQDEVRANNYETQLKELHDIATSAIFGIISMKSGKMDW